MEKYYYKTATEVVEIEVSEEWYEKLRQLDRDGFNNFRNESMKHLSLNEEGTWTSYEDNNIEKLFQIGKSERERLHDAIDQLKPAQKEIILMIFFEGKTQEEAAILLGVSQPAIAKRLRFAKKNIKKFMQKGL